MVVLRMPEFQLLNIRKGHGVYNGDVAGRFTFDRFRSEFYTAGAELIDRIAHFVNRGASHNKTIGAFTKRAEHRSNTKSQHNADKSSHSWYLKKGGQIEHSLYCHGKKIA